LAGLGALGVGLASDWIESYYVIPFILGVICLPMIALGDLLQGLARANSWALLALSPTYLVRPVLILVFMALMLGLHYVPDAKTAILYQHDDLGKDFIEGFKAELGPAFDKKVVTSSYEVSQPTIDSQIVSLKSSGATVMLFAGTPKFAAQAIRKTHESGWKPLFITNLISSSIAAVLQPAGLDISTGVMRATYRKDPDDPKWVNDAGVKMYRSFMEKYMQGADLADSNYFTGIHQGVVLETVLKQCGNDLSRENILKQTRNIKNLALPMSLPGIVVNTSATNNKMYTQLNLQRWNGKAWDLVGGLISDDAK
jgi:ABC-type branched-subunit amino acid transport system substrate-binding protein